MSYVPPASAPHLKHKIQFAYESCIIVALTHQD